MNSMIPSTSLLALRMAIDCPKGSAVMVSTECPDTQAEFANNMPQENWDRTLQAWADNEQKGPCFLFSLQVEA